MTYLLFTGVYKYFFAVIKIIKLELREIATAFGLRYVTI